MLKFFFEVFMNHPKLDPTDDPLYYFGKYTLSHFGILSLDDD